MKMLACIPARYGSSRFPGKLLKEVFGKSILQRSYENANAFFPQVWILAADAKIFDHAKSFGARVLMTPEHCSSGTERILHALSTESFLQETEIIVNVQGDEPCLDSSIFQALIDALEASPIASLSTAVAPFSDLSQVSCPSRVKCVFDEQDHALYFSRAPIPHAYSTKNSATYYQHLGIYAFKTKALQQFDSLPKTLLRSVEDLEQLTFLEKGMRIALAKLPFAPPAVDLPEDLQRLKEFLCNDISS